MMRNMPFNPLVLITVLLQAAVQAWFLTRYFQESRREFLLYTGFFALVLYPADLLIPYDHSVFKNILNIALLLILLWKLHPELTIRKLLLALVLYWLPMPFGEIPVFILNWLFPVSPERITRSSTLLGTPDLTIFFLQLVATGCLALIYQGVLSRTGSGKDQTALMYLTSLLASLAVTAFICLCFLYPDGRQTSYFQYPVAIVILALFNVWFVISLHRYVKQQTELRASQLIRQEYRRQMQQMLKPELSRQELRRFRHDLINELEHRRLSGQSE